MILNVFIFQNLIPNLIYQLNDVLFRTTASFNPFARDAGRKPEKC